MPKTRSKKTISINQLAVSGFLVALSVTLTRFISIMIPVGGAQTVRVGLGSIPIQIAGYLFGPLIGGVTGVAADLIGVAINPMGPPHLGFTLSSMLNGLIPGVFSIYFRKNKIDGSNFSIPRVIITQLTIGVIVSIFLTTLWISRLYGTPYFVTMGPRLISTAINVPVNIIINYNLLKKLERIV